MRLKNSINRNSKDELDILDSKTINQETNLEIDDLLSFLPERNRNIIKDRYILNMKLRELAKKYKYSRQSISVIISQSIKAIRKKFGVSLDKETI